MLKSVSVQNQIKSMLEQLVSDGILPAGTKIDIYNGQIDIVKLTVEAVTLPAILINFAEDNPGGGVSPEPDSQLRYTLLICTDSKDGLTESMTLSDTLKDNLPGEWTDSQGNRLFDVFIGVIRPVFNLRLKQVLSLPLEVAE